jgi:hypothetical protein
MASEAAHMHLVHNGLHGWPPERSVALPVVGGRIDHHALHRGRAVVPGRAGGAAIVAGRHGHAPAIGVEEDLLGIEAQAICGIPRPLDPIAVDLAWLRAGDEHVPVVVGPVGDRVDADRARGLSIVDVVEEQQLDAGGMLREDAEVRPTLAWRRAERRAGAVRDARQRVRSDRHSSGFEHRRHDRLRADSPAATAGSRARTLTSS